MKNVMYVSYNYFLILEVHMISNPEEPCYWKILNNEGITATLAGAVFIMTLRGEHDFSEPDHPKSESEDDSVNIRVYLVREQRIIFQINDFRQNSSRLTQNHDFSMSELFVSRELKIEFSSKTKILRSRTG